MAVEIAIIIALVLLNGVFSGAEIAILSVRRTRLQELAGEGRRSAVALLRLRQDPETFLATVQVGITVIGATAAAFGGASVAKAISPLFASWPTLAPYAEDIALAIVVVFVSYLSLVLGELIPKSLALRAGETYALAVAIPILALAKAGRPIVRALTASSNVVLGLFGDKTTFTETRLSEEELQQMVEEAATAGSVDPHVGEIASRALDLSKLDAYTVMVPRSEILMLPRQISAKEVAKIAQEKGFARAPVYDGSRDNIVGFVNLREVLAQAVLEEQLDLGPLLHPLQYVPDTVSAPVLLRRLQEERTHLILVVNEQGTLVGLVTIEDLVEELVGDILSENDPAPATVVEQPDGSWLIAGNVPVHEVARQLGRELPEGEFATLAGLCMELAGAVPQPGTVLKEDGITFEIVEATPRRVKWVRVRAPAPPDEEHDARVGGE